MDSMERSGEFWFGFVAHFARFVASFALQRLGKMPVAKMALSLQFERRCLPNEFSQCLACINLLSIWLPGWAHCCTSVNPTARAGVQKYKCNSISLRFFF